MVFVILKTAAYYVIVLGKEKTMEDYEDLFKPGFLRNQRESALPKNPQVTMAYIPLQTELITYDDTKGLSQGTIFPELNKPFTGKMVKQI